MCEINSLLPAECIRFSLERKHQTLQCLVACLKQPILTQLMRQQRLRVIRKMDEKLRKIEEVGVDLLYELVVRDKMVLTVGTLCQVLDTVEGIRGGDRDARKVDR